MKQMLAIADALESRAASLSAGLHWDETAEARELLAKIDAFGCLSDRWYGECPDVAKAFSEAANEAESELDDLRRAALLNALGYADSNERWSDEQFDTWDALDDETPSVRDAIQSARRNHAGDSYLERFAA